MNTLSATAWLELAERQHARAMAGDATAANWCGKFAPALDAAAGWRAYYGLKRHYDRVMVWAEGCNKLALGLWQWDSPETHTWTKACAEQWRDVTLNLEGASPQALAEIQEAIADFLTILIDREGIEAARDLLPPDKFEELKALLAGQEQGDGD